jgi:SNF2 family DNA or RNA helicase
MVRISYNSDAPHKVNVAWKTKKDFYAVLNLVKGYVGAYCKNQVWRLSIDDARDFISSVLEQTEETVHVEHEVFSNLFTSFKEKKEILLLREKLSGIDSGITLISPHKLLPFQHISVEFISKAQNGLIADKVGLGKTLSGFCSAYRLKKDGVVKKCLIIAPSSIKVKWARDIKKFLGEECCVLEGGVEIRKKKWIEWQNDETSFFCITSYDTLKKDILVHTTGGGYTFNESSYFSEYTTQDYCIIMDEVQKIRNARTARGHCCRELSKFHHCKSRIGLSATYVETGLEDLFGVMLVIDENVFGSNLYAFETTFIERDFMGKIRDYKNVAAAAEKMKYVSVRRNKEMVKDQLNAFLPKVNENTLWIELSKQQKRISNEIIAKCVKMFHDMEKQDKINATSAMTEIGYLRQVALSAEMIDPECKESAKIDALLDMLPEIVEDNKVLIFCFFTKFIDIMERELKKAGIKCLAMHGGRVEGKEKNRQKIVDQFSSSKDINVLLTSDILKEGIDVPAASYVINTDTLWNPAGMIQRCGRIDRLNQTAPNLYTINLWGEGSIEAQMYEIIYKRQELADQIIDGGNTEKRFHRVSFKDLKVMLRNMGGNI